MVECFLAKEDVAGSTPVSRSKHPLPAVHFPYNLQGWNNLPTKRRGTQVVRERSAKPLCVGSIPTRASKFFKPFLINHTQTKPCSILVRAQLARFRLVHRQKCSDPPCFGTRLIMADCRQQKSNRSRHRAIVGDDCKLLQYLGIPPVAERHT